MVVVTIVAALVTLVLVALASARRAARAQACAATLRQLATLAAQYGSDYRDEFPYGFSDGPFDTPYQQAVNTDDPFAWNGYITLAGSRPWLAMARAFGKERMYRRPVCPSDNRPETVPNSLTPDGRPQESPSSYWFSAALYIDAKTLDPSRPVWTRSSPRPSRYSDVQQPSRKALVFDSSPFHDGWDANSVTFAATPFKRCAAAVDGSAQMRGRDEQINGVALSVADHRVSDESLGVVYRLMLTPFGVKGADW
ncbi:MAG: hypothetical protein K2Q09_11015 [Phycisphaerales bacterium]|nr:hypothetical protein [Phycisphaerales bacterium]